MLRELHISGLGVIEDLDLELHPGLNVLTGETGAGKTMVTVGLALALGARASAALVRAGSKAARVQARFQAPPGAPWDEWAEDGELVLARSVEADGRSSARIGGQLASASTLAELAAGLVEIHGQHQGLRLLSASAQTEFLDRFAGLEHLKRVAEHRDLRERARRVAAKLAELESRARDGERELDLVDHQIREIETARIRPGELAELLAEESRLAHAERLLERAAEARAAIADDGGGADALARAAAALREVAAMDPGVAPFRERVDALVEEAGELARGLRVYQEGIALDPERLIRVRERIQAIRSLERKYGEGEEEVLAVLDRLRERRRRLASADDDSARLRAESGELDARLSGLAAEIGRTRAASAPWLAAAVRDELRELGMPDAQVEVALRPPRDPSGTEQAELLFSPGPGQVLAPLARVGSGGELSRTMLACRSVMVDLDDVPTLVFDEVDAGIGGRAAIAVGERLARLARSRQILVVTHLPQIASFADRHIRVEKSRGTATAKVVEDEERVGELSRMLSGLSESEVAALHAEELLARARRRVGRP
ncbi:MAG TPA: DNA repair protein RecN [Actinomycetota bacterium]|nr:DNA repair protein RecN [Actinomycetota bacterium]